jgi:type II secretory pathway pseudopilin PulG
MTHSANQHRRSGFLAMEVLVALLLLLALAIVLAVSAGMRLRTAQRLADQRLALAAAEEVLSNLRSGGSPTSADASARVSISRSGKPLASMEWIQVTVLREGRRATLVGLAPTTQPGGAP